MGPTRRIAKWNAKFDTERVKGTLDAMRPSMLQNVNSVVPMITAMELQVKQICDGAGGAHHPVPFYLCFGREMWKLTREQPSPVSRSRLKRPCW